MLADMLLEMKRPEQALAEYQGDLKFNPKRLNCLYGAARAAERRGKLRRQRSIRPCWSKTCEGSSSERPELAKAKQAVAARSRSYFSILCRRNSSVPHPSLARICTGV